MSSIAGLEKVLDITPIHIDISDLYYNYRNEMTTKDDCPCYPH